VARPIRLPKGLTEETLREAVADALDNLSSTAAPGEVDDFLRSDRPEIFRPLAAGRSTEGRLELYRRLGVRPHREKGARKGKWVEEGVHQAEAKEAVPGYPRFPGRPPVRFGDLHSVTTYHEPGNDPRGAWPLRPWGEAVLWGLAAAPFWSVLLALLSPAFRAEFVIIAIFLSPGPWYARKVRREAREDLDSEVVEEQPIRSANPAASYRLLLTRRDGRVVSTDRVVFMQRIPPGGAALNIHEMRRFPSSLVADSAPRDETKQTGYFVVGSMSLGPSRGG